MNNIEIKMQKIIFYLKTFNFNLELCGDEWLSMKYLSSNWISLFLIKIYRSKVENWDQHQDQHQDQDEDEDEDEGEDEDEDNLKVLINTHPILRWHVSRKGIKTIA